MSSYKISPYLISKFKEIVDHDIQVMGLLAEIVDYIDDRTLRAIITSMIGDENGHVRLFTLLLSQVTYCPSCHCYHLKR